MNNMSVDWLMNVLAMATDTVNTYVVTRLIFTSMGALAIISLIFRNLKARFYPFIRGYSPLQIHDERPELLSDQALVPDAFENSFFRSSREILHRADVSDNMKSDHMDLPF